jgi:hypothetical protein
MWWIAACLGALLWLLVVRIKLKEKQRTAELDERQAKAWASERAVLVKQDFLPAARSYLEQHGEVACLALLFAVFEWPNKPAEVHVCVMPVRQSEVHWPNLLEHSQWVTKVDGQWVFDAPEPHWNWFRAVGLSPRVEAFAALYPHVEDTTPLAEAYHLYAVVRRPGGAGAEWEVVGEPNF